MDYQVWTKEEYGDTFTKVDCGDVEAARREVDKAVRDGREPILTVEVPYELSIKVSEVGSETVKSKTRSDKGTRAESKGEVRSGDLAAVPELSEGSGDNKPDNCVPGR